MLSNSSDGEYSRNLCIILGATLGFLAIAIVGACFHVYIKDRRRRPAYRARAGSLWRRTVTPVDDAEIETWRRPTGQFQYDEKGFRVPGYQRISHPQPLMQQQPTLPSLTPAHPDSVRTSQRASGPVWAPWAEPPEYDVEAGYQNPRTSNNPYNAYLQAPAFPQQTHRASSRYSQPSQFSSRRSSRYSQPTELTLGSSDSRIISNLSHGRSSPDAACTSPRGLVIRTPSPPRGSQEHHGRFHHESQESNFDFGFVPGADGDDKGIEIYGDSPKSVSTANSSRPLSSYRMSDHF